MGASQSTSIGSMPQHQPRGDPPPGCPMHNGKDDPSSLPPSSSSAAASSSRGTLNPLNNMPDLAQAPAPGQKIALPLQRTMSSIPRANSSNVSTSACPVAHTSSAGGATISEVSSTSKKDAIKEAKPEAWEYPSPQQFYNALVRKGWETPEESIEMIVNIHNWLNEEAWQQVRRWEERHNGGDRSQLAQFQGRPKDLSPKARYHMMMGKIFPNYYGSLRPFDRHDWIVHRPTVRSSSDSSYTAPSSTQGFTSHRYVIDYYGLPDDADGNPVFSLDVRPAVDNFEAVKERLGEWWTLKKQTWLPSQSDTSPNGPPSPKVDQMPYLGVRVQEEK